MSHQHTVCLEREQAKSEPLRERLTPRQEQFLGLFRQLLDRNEGVSPSLEELAVAAGTTHASAAGLVKTLRVKGYLVKRGGVHRSLRLA